MAVTGPRTAVVVGVSSGIGGAAARALAADGWSVTGTVRGSDPEDLGYLSALVDGCELADAASVDRSASRIRESAGEWDALLVAPGTLEPIGRVADIDADAWAQSIAVNLVNQVRIVQGLLPSARRGHGPGPCVLFFAGGGSNSAPVGFSAYTVAKIALTKFAELLDAEEQDLRVAILGPGWVRTRIHDETLAGALTPSAAREETLRRLEDDDFVSMDTVLDVIRWAIDAPKSVIGGRNISVAGDPIHDEGFGAGLDADGSLLKLRRSGNDYAWMATT